MSIAFRCPACGRRHLSRLRARSPRDWLDWTPYLGDVLELCPGSNEWVTVRPPDTDWCLDALLDHAPPGP